MALVGGGDGGSDGSVVGTLGQRGAVADAGAAATTATATASVVAIMNRYKRQKTEVAAVDGGDGGNADGGGRPGSLSAASTRGDEPSTARQQRQRQRQPITRQQGRTTTTATSIAENSVVRVVLGPGAELLTLPEFVGRYVPAAAGVDLFAVLPEEESDDEKELLDDGYTTTTTTSRGGGAAGNNKKRRRRLLRYQIDRTLVAPSPGGGNGCGGCVVLTKNSGNRRRIGQSLCSLVDDVVWALAGQAERRRCCVRRRDDDVNDAVVAAPPPSNRRRRRHRAAETNYCAAKPNLLCQGYSVGAPYCGTGSGGSAAAASFAAPPTTTASSAPSSSAPALTMAHINNNVDYCKTSPLFRYVHERLGDDATRMLLMHCSIFVPVIERKSKKKKTSTTKSSGPKKDEIGNRGNYIQLAGPPLRPRLMLEDRKKAPTTASTEKGCGGDRKRKRKRGSGKKKDVDSDNVEETSPAVPRHLRPEATLSRKDLFYSNSYVPKIGLPSNHVLNDPSRNPRALLHDMVDLGCADVTGEGEDNDKNGKNARNKRRRRKRYKRVGEDGVRFCEEIYRRHGSLDYAR